jgi:hypothetical protein
MLQVPFHTRNAFTKEGALKTIPKQYDLFSAFGAVLFAARQAGLEWCAGAQCRSPRRKA